MRTSLILVLVLAVGIAMGAVGNQALHAQPASIKRTVLFKSEMTGVQGRDGYVMSVELAPLAQSGKHYHPGHEFNYVLEGEGVLEAEGEHPLPLKKGVSAHIEPRVVHNVKNTSAAPLRVVVFYVLERGQPVAILVN